MDLRIVLAPGAEDNGLATWASDLLRARLLPAGMPSDPRRTAEVATLRATVGIVAKDLRASATVRFDRGTVVVHDGTVGTPDITIVGALDVLQRIASLPLSGRLRLPLTRRWLAWASTMRPSELTIYGIAMHPRLVLRLLRLAAPG